MKKLFLLCALCALCASVVATASAEDFRHRVTGLFDAARVEDFQRLAAQLADVKLVSVDFATAEAVFSYEPAKLAPKNKPEQALERLDTLVRQASRGAFGVKPLSPTPRDQLTRVEIGVLGLDCRGCALGAYEAVAKLDGVEQATASFKEGRVVAWIDPKKTDRATLEAALKKKNIELKSP
jgi:cation transport ATPase